MNTKMKIILATALAMSGGLDRRKYVREERVRLSKEQQQAVKAERYGLEKFTFPDGYTVFARDKKNAERKHKNWVKYRV